MPTIEQLNTNTPMQTTHAEPQTRQRASCALGTGITTLAVGLLAGMMSISMRDDLPKTANVLSYVGASLGALSGLLIISSTMALYCRRPNTNPQATMHNQASAATESFNIPLVRIDLQSTAEGGVQFGLSTNNHRAIVVNPN